MQSFPWCVLQRSMPDLAPPGCGARSPQALDALYIPENEIAQLVAAKIPFSLAGQCELRTGPQGKDLSVNPQLLRKRAPDCVVRRLWRGFIFSYIHAFSPAHPT